VGTETNDVPRLVEGIAHGEVFAAVGIVPPFRYRLTVYNKIIHRRAVGVILVLGGFLADLGYLLCINSDQISHTKEK